jgi:hypothetical protein
MSVSRDADLSTPPLHGFVLVRPRLRGFFKNLAMLCHKSASA